MRKLLHCLLLLLLLAVTWSMGAAAEQPPCGIYILDSGRGPSKNRDANIRDYPFVTGYVLRTTWGDIETAKEVYDFSVVDHLIGKLEPLGQRLSLELFGPKVVPDYVTQTLGVTTWTFVDRNPNHPGTHVVPVPWDPYAMERFERFVEALAQHPVANAAAGGALVRLRDHPVLANVHLGLPGLRSVGIAVPGYTVADLPGYTPEKFTHAVLRSLRASTRNFPNQVTYLEIRGRVDPRVQTGSAEFDEIREAILKEFDGVKNPKVGLFEENLAAHRDPATGGIVGHPLPAFVRQLTLAKDVTYIMFQALTCWNRPFTGADKVRGATVLDGIQYAYETFGTKYVELYVPDLDDQRNWDGLQQWHDRLCQP